MTDHRASPTPEVSVVIPCLNEADTLATCLEKVHRAFRESAIVGEVIVADNGSTDGSVEIAASMGARIVHVAARGYGSALMGGIAASRGHFVVMGDADDSYDFLELPKLVAQLRTGDELVQGCRLPAGGGRVMPGAMPFLHRWLGNPLFSFLARRWFRAPVHDVYCGFRGFTRTLYNRLGQRCTGMEFATEMIIKSSLYGARISEVPVTLHPDGRKSHAPHLRTFRDGWRTLRFFLIYSPRWLFLVPGTALAGVGVLGYALALPGITVGSVTFDAHTLVVSSLAVLLGYQSMLFAVLTKTYAISDGWLPDDPLMTRFFEGMTLERGLLVAGTALAAGVSLLAAAVNEWRLAAFGALDYARTMRLVVPGATLTALGFQTVVSGFFVSILTMRRLSTASGADAAVPASALRAVTVPRGPGSRGLRSRRRVPSRIRRHGA
jgi:glycosyltransferase involved in cell wall biosynthesis